MSGPCPKCHEWPTYEGRHECPPRWLVWREGDDPDDGRELYARRPERAVEIWAEWDDRRSADYIIVGGSPATVLVREVDSSKAPLRYIVSGETVPEYRAQLAPTASPQRGGQ